LPKKLQDGGKPCKIQKHSVWILGEVDIVSGVLSESRESSHKKHESKRQGLDLNSVLENKVNLVMEGGYVLGGN
jgi:hypothetical protein